MKILVVSAILSPEIGGPASYVSEIIKRLGKEYQFRAITFTPNPNPIDGVEIVSVSQTGNTFIRQAKLFWQIFRNAFWSDLFYVMEPLVVGIPAGIIGFLFRKPVVIRFVGYQPWEESLANGVTEKYLDQFLTSPDGGVKAKILILATAMAFKMANQIIVPSKYLVTVLEKYFSVPRSKINHIYNAFEIPKVTPAPKSKIPTAISIGRLIYRKRVDWTIEAVALCTKNTGKFLQLLIVGDGPDRPRLERVAKDLVKKYKIKPFVAFLGQKSWLDGLSLLASADVYLLTSVYEGLPFTVVESLVLGTSVIATDVPGTSEIAINRVTALTSAAGDVRGLANNIEEIIKNSALSKKLVGTGQKLIKKEFNWSQNLKTTQGVFRLALDG